MESCPTDNKEKAMSLLHSFYSWGQAGVVLLSTLFFKFIGIENWHILSLIWALIPIVNAFVFIKTPIAPLIPENESGMSMKELFINKTFWILMIMMACSGASEQSVSQWASAFAEMGLNISKTAGDLAGPMTFAILMGSVRAFYGKYGDKLDLDRFMKLSTILCIASYLMITLSPSPIISLIGFGLCGISVGIMWPGTFSLSAETLPRGGTIMFAFLAFAGDVGCSSGPTVVGFMVDALGGDMKKGILFAAVFPLVLVIFLILHALHKKAVKKTAVY